MIERHTVAEAESAKLLDDYRAGSAFFFASPRRTLLAEGAAKEVVAGGEGPPADPAGWAGRVSALLGSADMADGSAPIVVGAIPFDAGSPARLVVPRTVRWAGPYVPGSESRGKSSPAPAGCAVRPVPEPAQYVRGVEQALALLGAGELGKVVLARTLHLTSPAAIDVRQLLRNLAECNAGGYTFAAGVSGREHDAARAGGAASARSRTLVGASPELLVSRSGRTVVSNPLAGSVARSADPVEDRRRAAALLESAKDRHEHALVADAVAEALRPYCRKLDVPAGPSLVHTETMWHLSSRIVGELDDPSVTSLELAAALHPTPAVCGVPTDRARAAIREIEPFDRGFYTGMVGWCEASGDGEWVVTIRCAEVEDRTLRLFAGAGIVNGSRAEDELAETTAKFRTLLLAMGLHGDF